MSVKIMSRVWEAGPKGQTERFVLLALADYCNDEGECWPSIRAICEKVCMSERGVQSVIRRLESSGWLSISTGNGRKGCNQYTIKTPQMDAKTPQEMHPAGNAPPPQMDAETPQMDVQNPAGDAPEPSRTIKEPSGRVREVLLSVLSEKVADDFIAHRKALKKKLTERAAELIVIKLTGCRDPDAVVNMSIMSGWQGVFPERENGQAKRSSAPDPDRQLSQWEYIAKHGTSEGWAA